MPTILSRPGFSVTSQLPSGSSAMPQGLTSPAATTMRSSSIQSSITGARVWPGKAGEKFRAFGGAALKSCAAAGAEQASSKARTARKDGRPRRRVIDVSRCSRGNATRARKRSNAPARKRFRTGAIIA